MLHLIGDAVDVKPEGYAVDKDYPDVVYLPENAAFSIPKQAISWTKDGKAQSVGLKPGVAYLLPNGYKVEMVKKGANSAVKEKAGTAGAGDSRLTTWRLKGTLAEGVHCHKPATVSGGGKSEISKRVRHTPAPLAPSPFSCPYTPSPASAAPRDGEPTLTTGPGVSSPEPSAPLRRTALLLIGGAAGGQVDDMITYGPVFVANINEDFDLVQKIVERDYTKILKDPSDETYGDHPIKKPGVLW